MCDAQEKIERGCEKDSSIPDVWRINGQTYQRCPVKLVTERSLEYLRAFFLFESGLDPEDGGWLYLGAKYLEAMSIIARERGRIESERAKG